MKNMIAQYSSIFVIYSLLSACGPFSSQQFQDGTIEPKTLTDLNLENPTPKPIAETTPASEPSIAAPAEKPVTVTQPTPTQEPVKPAATEPAVTAENHNAEPLAWELDPKTRSKFNTWSKMIYQIIQKQTPEILGQNVADDVEFFCPKYRTLKDSQRLNFWAQLFVGIAKFESSWNPTSSSTEYLMSGTDSVTGRRIVSEGLLQISYQDEKNYQIKCGFNWEKDKKLSKHDPKKTILDPYLNLNCGIQIFAQQLKRIHRIVAKEHRSLYWAVLYNGRSNKIKDVAKITNTLTFCK